MADTKTGNLAYSQGHIEKIRSSSEGAEDIAAVTPSDTVDLPGGPPRFLWVGGAGDITVITVAGATVLLKAVPLGRCDVSCIARVKATATTATNLVACY